MTAVVNPGPKGKAARKANGPALVLRNTLNSISLFAQLYARPAISGSGCIAPFLSHCITSLRWRNGVRLSHICSADLLSAIIIIIFEAGSFHQSYNCLCHMSRARSSLHFYHQPALGPSQRDPAFAPEKHRPEERLRTRMHAAPWRRTAEATTSSRRRRAWICSDWSGKDFCREQPLAEVSNGALSTTLSCASVCG